MSGVKNRQDFDNTFGYGVAVGIVLGVVVGIWTKDLLGALAIGVGVSLLFSYIWNS